MFTDAARHVYHGESPYERHTYRYTPFLAWMLYPNVSLSPLFGKVLFCAFDVLAGHLIYAFVKDFYRHFRDSVELKARAAALFWLFNPLVFVVSARGNAESVIVTLVLLFLHFFRERLFLLSGLAYGAAVHFKIYPVVYAPAVFLALSERRGLLSNLFHAGPARVRFVCGALVSFAGLTGLAYHLYGERFLEEALLYHLSRRDTRHNFSAYFYMLYLTVEDDDLGIGLLTFVPQLLLVLALALQFGSARDLPFCLFCQTVVFVTYNKVVTSQYFLWYLCLLPLSEPRLRMTKKEMFFCAFIWLFFQGSWLVPAFYLEFQGTNTFQVIWFESLAFFTGNVWLLSKLVRKYREAIAETNRVSDVSKVD